MKRILTFSLMLVMLAGFLFPVSSVSAAVVQDAASHTYTVLVGYENSKQGVDVEAYFPASLTIHVGDTIHWVQNSHEIHTVTFFPPNPPAPVVIGGAPAGAPSPVMFNPAMVNRSAPANGMYNGVGFVNSGLMGLDSANYHQFNLTFTQQGTFTYSCLIHGLMMSGTIKVVGAKVAVPLPQQASAMGRQQISQQLALVPAVWKEANAMVTPPTKNANGSTTYNVMMGFGKGKIDLMRFFPSKLEVHPGDTVHWYFMAGDQAPHSVTFLNGAADPNLVIPFPFMGTTLLVLNPTALFPSQPGLPLTRQGMFSSGIMNPNPAGFSMKIGNLNGMINYVCVIHDGSGMIASLVVER